jgi:hypothetical protein
MKKKMIGYKIQVYEHLVMLLGLKSRLGPSGGGGVHTPSYMAILLGSDERCLRTC